MGYDSERALQEIIHAHPSLVTGSPTGETGTAIACREFQSGVGPADVVVLDTEGNLTLIECKLASNREVRREIIGQVLDYASRIWRMNAEEFELAWARANGGVSPFDALDDAEGRIRAAVQENLESARFKIILAVDDINDDIRRIVEFLNRVTVAETGVLVVEFARASVGNTEVLIPTSFGTDFIEAKAAADPKSSRPRWSVDEYLAWCRENDEAAAEGARELIEALAEAGFRLDGGKAKTPSLNFGIDSPSIGTRTPVALYSTTNPARGALVEVRFSDYKDHPAIRDALADLVQAIPGIPIPVAEVRAQGFSTRPNISVRDFTVEQLRALPRAVAEALRR